MNNGKIKESVMSAEEKAIAAKVVRHTMMLSKEGYLNQLQKESLEN